MWPSNLWKLTTPPSGDKSEGGKRGGDGGALSVNVIFNPHALGSGTNAFML